MMEQFIATSGNACRYQIETKNNRLAVACTFQFKPSLADQTEFEEHIIANLKKQGYNIGKQSAALAGAKVAGKARQTEAIRRFLETGEPSGDELRVWKGGLGQAE